MNNKYLKLRSQINELGSYLDDIIASSDEPHITKIVINIKEKLKDTIRGSKEAEDSLYEYLSRLTDDDLISVSRVFGMYLNFSNVVEMHQIINKSLDVTEDDSSLRTTLSSLEIIKKKNITSDEVFSKIKNLKINPVLTTHPTELTRRSLYAKYLALDDCFYNLDIVTNQQEREDIETRTKELIAIAWFSNETHSYEPNILQESNWILNLVEDSLWDSIPKFLKNFDNNLQKVYEIELPIDYMPIKFSSVIGGDLYGNINNSPLQTEQIIYLSHKRAAELYLRDIKLLMSELIMRDSPEWLKVKYKIDKEPYRNILRTIRNKLKLTIEYFNSLINNISTNIRIEDTISKTDDLLIPMLDIYKALKESKIGILHKGQILGIIRKIQCFGLNICKIDILNHENSNSELMNEITKYLKLPEYNSLSEIEKLKFLTDCLDNNLDIDVISLDKYNQKLLDYFKLIAKYSLDEFSSYIISGVKNTSDILLVHALLKICNFNNIFEVIPIFESLESLRNIDSVLINLYSNTWYKSNIKKQNIMIGHNYSMYELGMISSIWEGYKAQCMAIKISNDFNIELGVNHGRGGAIGRGGAQAHAALISQPANSLSNGLKIIEQGEMIRFKYGQSGLSINSLDLYISALLIANTLPPQPPKSSWIKIMDSFSNQAYDFYSKFINENPDFYNFYLQATPNNELHKIYLGKKLHPVYSKENNIKSIRESMWTFAWMQNRMLISWLGFGDSLNKIINNEDEEIKNEFIKMVKKWPFIESRIEMMEMMLSKVDFDISNIYENKLLDDNLKYIGNKIREYGKKDKETLLKLKHLINKRSNSLMDSLPWLSQSIKLRNNFTIPIHLVQIEIIKRLRKSNNNNNKKLLQALIITLTGIIAGMRNTG